MNSIDFNSLDKDNTYFHFTNSGNLSLIESSGGIISRIGDNALGIEERSKIFFSVGFIGLLETVDVWLKWEMSRLYGKKNKIIDRGYNIKWDTFYEDWKSGEYKNKKEYIDILYEELYKDFEKRSYLSLDIHDKVEFDSNEIDDVKKRVINNDKEKLDLMYGSYSHTDDIKMERWNMATKPNITIPLNKINLINVNGKIDGISVILEAYRLANKENLSFDLLDGFINYSLNKRTNLVIEDMSKEEIKEIKEVTL